jgi:hypothetical protein
MHKFVSGKASILALTTVFAVASFLLGKSFTIVSAQPAPFITICHHNPSQEVTLTFMNEHSYNGHLGTPHNQETYDTNGPCSSTPTPLPSGQNPILGCIDPVAYNYDSEADTDDGSCKYSYPYCLNGDNIIMVREEDQAPEGATAGTCQTTTNDVCANIDGIQTSVPSDLHLDGGGINCVGFSPSGPAENTSTPSQGQVLGASTMAGAGSFAENAYLAIMGVGATLSAFGLKNLKKAFQKA